MRYSAPGAHTHLYIQEGASKMKHRLLLILMLVLTACLSACGKNTDTSDIEETAPVESTEDPFSLGGIEIDVDTSQTEAETEPAIEVEVIETDADGSKTSLYSDGSIRHTSNIDSLPEVDKLTESESLTLQTIVANWDADGTISSDYLKSNITTATFPSLTDTDCQRIRERIEKDNPHNESETVAYEPEETTAQETQSSQGEHVYTQEELEAMTDEERFQLIEELTGNRVIRPDEVTVNLDAAREIQLGGGQ